MKYRCRKSIVMFGICLLGFVSAALAQPPSVQGHIGWIGLYNEAMVEWLENENRLTTLCSHAAAHKEKWNACREVLMKPKRFVLQLRSAPQETATSEGTLVVLVTPGKPLRIFYQSGRGRRELEFVPDLFDSDWGYGPYFHQTFLERRGTWFLLPATPFPKPVWVDISQIANEPAVRLLQAGDIIKIPQGDVLVLDADRTIVRARQEQAADMWCQEGHAPPLQPSPEMRIPVETLYGPTGHLLVDIKYKRGC